MKDIDYPYHALLVLLSVTLIGKLLALSLLGAVGLSCGYFTALYAAQMLETRKQLSLPRLWVSATYMLVLTAAILAGASGSLLAQHFFAATPGAGSVAGYSTGLLTFSVFLLQVRLDAFGQWLEEKS